ncbi:aminotransferase class V-fold PLP-dependent enzyme [Spirosoma telluris]|uniref:aminotransferase class V-fold PLP-dependent enzyme n=1 Tax=Spirosoma telluris TaxID=2183553 RepID=UPI0038CDBBDA
MSTRRTFFRQTAAAATGALTLPQFLPETFARPIPTADAALKSAAEWAQDEDFWSWVKSEYTVSPTLLNLNNGGVCPQPKVVQDAHIRFYQYCNEAPSYYMWRILDQGRESLREKLADLGGCSPEEIAINRNATEGLNTVIFGLNLKPGDEVVLTKQDYPNMLNAWKQREKRDGIKLVYLDLELPSEDDKYLTEQYVKAFTPRTKVVHITHMINWIGQVMPVRKIADEAHKRGIEVIADGAHSFALFDFKIPDLGADYYATSLHKWLCAPSAVVCSISSKTKSETYGPYSPTTNPMGRIFANSRAWERARLLPKWPLVRRLIFITASGQLVNLRGRITLKTIGWNGLKTCPV